MHLLLGAILVWAVGASWLEGGLNALAFIVNSVLFVLAFILHELAHKLSAIKYGYDAKFRLHTWGAVITAISVFLPLKIIAPGATVVYGPYDRGLMGKVALWGPLVNIAMAAILLPSARLAPQLGLQVAAYVSAFIALFNLLPFWVLDGLKVLRWRREAWAISFIASSLFLILTWFP